MGLEQYVAEIQYHLPLSTYNITFSTNWDIKIALKLFLLTF